MRVTTVLALGIVVCAVSVAPALRAQTAQGQIYFEQYCVTCHGTSARGDGPLARSLRVRPADLTQLAIRNDGTFPAERVQKSIDGRARTGAPSHTDMPVWADIFAKMSDSQGPEDVDSKINALVKYVEKLQVKQ